MGLEVLSDGLATASHVLRTTRHDTGNHRSEDLALPEQHVIQRVFHPVPVSLTGMHISPARQHSIFPGR